MKRSIDSRNILITGGIGDFITLESFMLESERKSIESIFYATRAQKIIQEISQSLPSFPNLKNHIILWDDFSQRFSFASKNEVITALATKSRKITNNTERNKSERLFTLLKDITDYSINAIFREIPNLRPYNNSSLLIHKIADISKFSLPKDFFIICPYTPNDRRNPRRDFDKKDWNIILTFLEKIKIPGVVLNIGNDYIPESQYIINMTNASNFCESVEILKLAKGYFGIDSSLSVLAAKLFNEPNLVIKSNNNHCYINKHIYYAPHNRKFNFIKRSIEI